MFLHGSISRIGSAGEFCFAFLMQDLSESNWIWRFLKVHRSGVQNYSPTWIGLMLSVSLGLNETSN